MIEPSPPPDPGSPPAGLYVFCVTQAAVAVPEGPGLTPDTQLERLPQGELAAVVCRVPLAEWTGPDAEARLRDLNWLGPRAVRHEAVIELVMAQGPVLPLRFGSLFSSDASVKAWLAAETATIAAFFAESAAFEEWSLKGWLAAAQAEAALLADDPRAKRLPASPGARYLLEQKLRQDIAKSVRSWARGVEPQVLAALSGLVARTRALRALAGDVSGRSEEVMFHQALLVPKLRRQELTDKVTELAAELQERGLTLELTGPWPLYSFVPALAPAAADPAAAQEPHG